MNTTLAAERVSHRFQDEYERRAAAPRVVEWARPAAAPLDSAARVEAVPGRFHEAPAPRPVAPVARFEAVPGQRDETPAPRPASTVARFEAVPGRRGETPASRTAPRAESPFSAAASAAWSPVPAPTQTVAVEQYRRLAATLIQAQAERAVKVVLIASSVVGEGKSLTAANLAVTLARSYRRDTLLIDADQRAPFQHEIFHVRNSRGLSDWLDGRDDAGIATLQLLPGLTLLTAGRPTTDPMAGLTSARMTDLLAKASAAFDFVIIDAPPATLVPDAGILAALADTTVLVIGAGSTPCDTIQRAIAAVGRERILGTVLNRADIVSAGHYGYGYPGE